MKIVSIGTEQTDRCRTGIEGLDNILNGGVPRGNQILITGSCGTGKTTLCLEFLMHGALDGENCLYLSVTEPSSKLIKNLRHYEFFNEKLIDEGKLVFIDMPALYDRLGLQKSEFSFEEIDLLVHAIGSIVRELNIKRLVIDSITSVCFQLKTEEKIREFVLRVGKNLSDFGCTSFLVSELMAGQKDRYSMYGVEEAVADGIVLLGNLERRGDLLRTLQVIKMRATTHSRAKYVLDLTHIGILVVPLLKGGSAET